MSAIAVNPMAAPIRTLLMNGSRIASLKGDRVYSNRAVNRQAESIKQPSPAASMRYSGQCLRAAVHMTIRAEALQPHQGYASARVKSINARLCRFLTDFTSV